jgi:hypothetical protein
VYMCVVYIHMFNKIFLFPLVVLGFEVLLFARQSLTTLSFMFFNGRTYFLNIFIGFKFVVTCPVNALTVMRI